MSGFQAGHSRNILVVEDDATLARVIVRGLNARGYETRGVATLSEALAFVGSLSPAVILLDIDLPDGSGWDLLRSARALRSATAKVIVMSALRPNPRLISEFGCFGFLEKPFPIQALLRQVEASFEPVGVGQGGAHMLDQSA